MSNSPAENEWANACAAIGARMRLLVQERECLINAYESGSNLTEDSYAQVLADLECEMFKVEIERKRVVARRP
jgi:hypothetical protein